MLVLCCALSNLALAHSGKSSEPLRPSREKSARALQNASTPYLDLTVDATTTPAYRYAQMPRTKCEAELKQRHIPWKRESARGVLAPVRLLGPIRGILFRGEGTDEERAKNLHEILDCRLVLALDDLTESLHKHHIVEVRHFSMYRLPEDSWPRGKPATRHMGGLAIDAGIFIRKDGSVLNVDRHFHGAIGAKTCGPGARPRPATPEAVELRELLCEIAARRLFNVVLTPNFNAPHKNHFHLEVTAGKTWFLLH